MANSNTPRGAEPVKHLNGSNWNGTANLYRIPSTDGNAYYLGDVVKSAAGSDVNGIRNIQQAGNTDTVRGIVVGLVPASINPGNVSLQGTSLTLETLTVPATKTQDYYAYVVDQPDIVFEIQDDGTTYPGAGTVTANQEAASNKNTTLVVAAPSSGSFSATTISAANVATTNTLNVKILGKVVRTSNDFGTAYVRWLCAFNLHELSPAGSTGA